MINISSDLMIQIHRAVLGGAIALVVVGVFLFFSLIYLLIVRRDRIVRDFALLQAVLLVFLGGYVMYASANHITLVDFWTRVCYTGVVFTPLAFHVLVGSIIQERRPRLLAGLAVVSVILTAWLWLDRTWLVTEQLRPLTEQSHPRMIEGPAFFYFVLLIFALIVTSFARFVRHALLHRDFLQDAWPLLLGFAGWLLGSLYDAVIALDQVPGDAQPWIGPVVMVIMLAVYVGRLTMHRGRESERRTAALDSLQAVGEALSTSLDLDAILAAIYAQVTRLMEAHIFYVALWDKQTGEISFPLFIENGQRLSLPARGWKNGLTEYVLRTRKPLLISRNLTAELQAMGLDLIGRPPTCWLGVPLLAGEDVLGVISVQSLTTPDMYTEEQRDLLMTIASQAVMAIQNARLYARTDEALAQRVQELDSILRTAYDGILLLDRPLRVLAANRALADILGVAQGEWAGRYLREAPPASPGTPLLQHTGYSLDSLRADCQLLVEERLPLKKQLLVLSGSPQRYVERTLAPVRDVEGEITGWLMIFHDVTEQRRLENLREEFTNMLVHDLRSPMTVLQSSLEIMQQDLEDDYYDDLPKLVGLARQGGDRMVHLINQLLDVNKLEEGEMPVHPQELNVPKMLADIAAQLEPLARQEELQIKVVCEASLPVLFADPDLVGRALINLLDNAIKFSPDGETIELWARQDITSREPILLLGVTDRGPGIPQSAQKHLFQKFKQVIVKGARRRGTGLGLLFCRLVVEAHHGEIWVDSQEGRGSTFIMRLPARFEAAT